MIRFLSRSLAVAALIAAAAAAAYADGSVGKNGTAGPPNSTQKKDIKR